MQRAGSSSPRRLITLFLLDSRLEPSFALPSTDWVAHTRPTSPRRPPVAPHLVPTMSTQIPTARVNRIIKADKDVRLCSKEAVFLIAKATVSWEASFGRVVRGEG